MSVHRPPRRGSAPHTLLRRLLAIGGAATQAVWRDVAGLGLTEREFAQRIVSPLLRHGLVTDGLAYAITPAGRAFIGEALPDIPQAAPAQIAAPRTVPPFKPLQRSSKSTIVYRDGAFDYRNSPSLMGGQRVPYRTPT